MWIDEVLLSPAPQHAGGVLGDIPLDDQILDLVIGVHDVGVRGEHEILDVLEETEVVIPVFHRHLGGLYVVEQLLLQAQTAILPPLIAEGAPWRARHNVRIGIIVTVIDIGPARHRGLRLITTPSRLGRTVVRLVEALVEPIGL